jgi:hypothetical protein
MLQAVLKEEGSLSGVVIDERADMPSSSAYRYRFGSLIRAYNLIGYIPERDYRYIEINRHVREAYPQVLNDIASGFERAGGEVARNEESQLLTINRGFTVLYGNSRWNTASAVSRSGDSETNERYDCRSAGANGGRAVAATASNNIYPRHIWSRPSASDSRQRIPRKARWQSQSG